MCWRPAVRAIWLIHGLCEGRVAAAQSVTVGSAVAAATPHPDATGSGSNTIGTDVFLVMSFLPPGFSKPQYKVRSHASEMNSQ